MRLQCSVGFALRPVAPLAGVALNAIELGGATVNANDTPLSARIDEPENPLTCHEYDPAASTAVCDVPLTGCHEVLRRQGLLEGIWCLDPHEGLSPGQAAEIDRVYRAWPELNDDVFVAENLDRWLS